MEPLTAATLSHLGDGSLRLPRFAFQTSRPQPRHAPTRRFCSHLSACSMFQASPCVSRLADTLRRIGFVILRAVFSLPVALHPASQRRSFLQLHSGDILWLGLAPCRQSALTDALTPAHAGVQVIAPILLPPRLPHALSPSQAGEGDTGVRRKDEFRLVQSLLSH